MVASLIDVTGFESPVLDFGTLCRRQKHLTFYLAFDPASGARDPFACERWCNRWGPSGPLRPTLTADRTAGKARWRGGRHAAARPSMLARRETTLHARLTGIGTFFVTSPPLDSRHPRDLVSTIWP